MLYPLTFQPIFQERVWGGRNLERLYQKPLPPTARIGESWELCDRPGAVSVIANGPLAGKDLRWLMENHREELLGQAAPLRGRFPLLVKLLDAQQRLSLQVHPPPAAAAKLGGEPKSELWYVADAAPGAELMAGLKRGTTRAEFEQRLKAGTVADSVHRLPVKAGDALFLPSGRLHAGGGAVIIEIQQNADTTYRLFDWKRPGLDGQPRQLHVAQALASIDFNDWAPALVQSRFKHRRGALERPLADDPLLVVDECQAEAGAEVPFFGSDRPLVLGVVSGRLIVKHAASGQVLSLGPGGFCLLPAAVDDVVVAAQSEVTYLVAEPGEGEAEEPTEAATERAVTPTWQSYRPARRRRSRRRLGGWLSRQRLKKMLTKRFTYSPLLKMLVFKFWFRLVFLICLGVALFMALFLPKMWRVSPKGFLPVVKISGLDNLQAAMLRRTAQQATAAGQFEQAAYAWQAALAQNPADADLARGQVRSVLAQEPPNPKLGGPAVRSCFWLLRLTQTNQADLELAVKLYEKFRLYELISQLLRPQAAALTGSLQTAYLKAQFYQRQMAEFASGWKRLTPAQQAEPEMALFHAAYLAAWGPPETAAEGKQRLAAALDGPAPLRVVANRLVLAVYARLDDASRFGEALRRLQQARADSALDHVQYWRLLAASGQKREAAELARNYVYPPASSVEVVQLAEMDAALGLNEQALQLLERYAPQFSFSDQLWTLYANLLIQEKQWDELRAIASQIRHVETVRDQLEAFSFYLQARADFAQRRRELAESALEQAARRPFPNPALGMAVAAGSLKLGYPDTAKTILLKLETGQSTNLTYWQAAFDAALELKDGEWLLKSARHLYQAQPASPTQLNRYAAALLVNRQQTDEAVQLTRQLLTAYPRSVAAVINHSIALLLNQRTAEAQALLATVNAMALEGEEAHAYYLAQFELCLQQQELEAARQALAGVDKARLFPAQQRWLEQAQARLPPARQ
jgi:mannose-6-phosphate isomerase